MTTRYRPLWVRLVWYFIYLWVGACIGLVGGAMLVWIYRSIGEFSFLVSFGVVFSFVLVYAIFSRRGL